MGERKHGTLLNTRLGEDKRRRSESKRPEARSVEFCRHELWTPNDWRASKYGLSVYIIRIQINMSLALLHFLNKFNKGRWTLKKPTIDLSTLSPSQYPLAYAPFFRVIARPRADSQSPPTALISNSTPTCSFFFSLHPPLLPLVVCALSFPLRLCTASDDRSIFLGMVQSGDDSPLAPLLSVSAFVMPIIRAFYSSEVPIFHRVPVTAYNRSNILSTLRASGTHTSSTPLRPLAACLLSARLLPSPSQNPDCISFLHGILLSSRLRLNT